MTNETDAAKVEQCDRVAAAHCLRNAGIINGREFDQILRGKPVFRDVVQAFARHRIAAEQRAHSADSAGLVEAIRRAAKNAEPKRGEIALHASDWFAIMDALATPAPIDGPRVPEGYVMVPRGSLQSIKAVTDLANDYGEYIASVDYSDIERHPYLPGVEQAVEDARAMLAAAEKT